MVGTDFVAERGAGRWKRQVGDAPPAAGITVGLVVPPIHFRHAGFTASDTSGSFRPGGAVGGIINKHAVATESGRSFGPKNQVVRSLHELKGCGVGQAAHGAVGIVVVPRDHGPAKVVPVIGIGRRS